ncbi:MAG: DUF5054 domain-containing protein [Bacteroidaceae bacterium]
MTNTRGAVKRWTLLLFAMVACTVIGVAQPNNEVKKVYVVFKTHLDVGFTDLSSVVTKRYVEDFIPKAIAVGEKLRADGSGDRYVWTTGAWLVEKYLREASASDVARLERAIEHGDIVWNAVPYTFESEVMSDDLFRTCLSLSQKLDRRYGKRTIAAKMTDVPGHTRSIVSPLSDAGVRFLHIGVNPASPIPSVSDYCLWRDTNGKEIILAYQRDYGTENVLPDGMTAVSINFTGDNHGPHSYEAVKRIYADLRERYPEAQIVGASFNEIAKQLLAIKDKLPVVTSEIGDTWIYGYGSAPSRMAKFRELSRLYSKWIEQGKINRESDEAIDFAIELGLIAEHTQGMDIKTHLANWDKYDMDVFTEARNSEPFVKVEQSWKEIDGYLLSAIEKLPKRLQSRARNAIADIDRPNVKSIKVRTPAAQADEWQTDVLGGLLKVLGVTYRCYDAADYEGYLGRYLRARYGWALDDIGKTGLDQSHAVSASVKARVVNSRSKSTTKGTLYEARLEFVPEKGIDPRVLPEQLQVRCMACKGGRKADLTVVVVNKPAVRLPEAYFCSFVVDGLKKVVAEKVGERVDLSDVVEKGNRHMHGIDGYVDLITDNHTIRVWSKDAFLVNLGEPDGLAYSTEYPSISGGIHFCLNNNLWGTNFTMWNEGSMAYRFTLELMD